MARPHAHAAPPRIGEEDLLAVKNIRNAMEWDKRLEDAKVAQVQTTANGFDARVELTPAEGDGLTYVGVPGEVHRSFLDADSKGGFFESAQGKSYRHATYYTKSEGVKHL